MSHNINKLGAGLYVALGGANLVVALLITMGGLFSSLGFGVGMMLLVDLPITFGLVGYSGFRRISPLFMAFGCVAIVIYIVHYTYYTLKSGYPMLLFHKAWVT